MIFQTPSYLFALSICLAPLPARALPDLRLRDTWAAVRSLPRALVNWPSIPRRADTSGINFNPNGSAFLWVPEDTYAGKTFFE